MDKPNAGPSAPLRKAIAGTTVHQKGVREVGGKPLTIVPIEYLLDISSDWNSAHMGKAKGVAYLAEAANGSLSLAVAQGSARDDLWSFSSYGASVEPGFWNYSDISTATVPLFVTSGSGPLKVTNDAASAFTTDVYKPLSMTTPVWDVVRQEFNLTQFNPRDVISFRFNALATTSSPNTNIDVNLVLGVGGFPYRINFIERNEKVAGDHRLDVTNIVYAGASPEDLNTINNPAYFEITSDGDVSLEVRSFVVAVTHVV